MLWNSPANRRIRSLIRILGDANPIIANNVRAYVTAESVSIGGITKEISKEKRPEYVPRNYCKVLLISLIYSAYLLCFR